MHAHSIALIAPLSVLFYIWVTGGTQSTLGRYVHPSTAKSIGPAIFLGYVVPTTLLFIPFVSGVYGGHLITAWLFASISISTILVFLPRVLDKAGKKPGVEDTKDALAQYRNEDVPVLRNTYKIAFAASLIHHAATVVFPLLGTGHPALSPSRFLPSSSSPTSLSVSTPMFLFLKQDLFYVILAVALFGLYNVFELRAKGLVTTPRALRAAAVFLGAQGVVGPGAALVALWWWREGVMVGREGEKKAGKA